MAENIDLLKRREELKLALSEGNYKTMVDIMMDWVNHPFRKSIGNHRTLSLIFGALIIYLLTMMIGVLVVAFMGEFGKLSQITARYTWWFYLSFISAPLSMTVANEFVHRIISILRDYVLQIAETVETLDEIEKWVNFVCNKKLTLLLGVVFGSLVASMGVLLNLNTSFSIFVGIGFNATFILFAIQSSLFVFFLFAVFLLTIGMRRFDLMLFPADPGSSKIITTLSGLMNSFVFLFALYAAILTYGIMSMDLLSTFYRILPMLWGLIVLIFAIYQYSLAKIIQREKWKTLNVIQSQIEKIQKEQAIPDKETRETLIWLLDYHNRVKATRNSALNFETGLNLFNSLLLPVLAFVLGNIDKVIAFFR